MKPKRKRPVVQIGDKFWSLVSLVGLILFAFLALYMQSCVSITVKPAWSPESETAFQWVIKEMALQSYYHKKIDEQRPVLRIVSTRVVRKVYKESTKETFERYYKQLIELGKTHEEAQAEVENYLAAPGALFNPKTNEIYIGTDGLSECRIGARVAHEITHFIQVKVYERLNPDMPGPLLYDSLMRREAQALFIERSFGKENCPGEYKTWKQYLL